MSKRTEERTAAGPLWRRRTGLSAAIVTAAVASMVAASTSHAEPAAEPAAGVPQTGEELAETLRGLLPDTLEITESSGSGLDEGPDAYASLLAEDGSGGTSFDLSVSRWATDDWHDIAGCQGFGEPQEGFTCEDTVLPDGSILSYVSWETEEEGDAEEGTEPYHDRQWEVWLEGPGGESLEEPGGRAVVFTQTKDLTGAEDPDAYVPLLGFEQLAEIAQAPVWQELLDAADEQYGAPEGGEEVPGSDIPAAALRDTFRALAPEGLEITDGAEEDPGHASVTVDDGEGPGLVEITAYAAPDEAGDGLQEAATGEDFTVAAVEDAASSPAGAGAADEPVCEDTVLEDGTQLSVCDWPASADDPLAMSWAVVTYTDGSSLDLTAYNTADWASEPSRADTPLSGQELAGIATAGEWRALFG